MPVCENRRIAQRAAKALRSSLTLRCSAFGSFLLRWRYAKTTFSREALSAIACSKERKRTWDETPDSCCKMGIKKARITSAWVNVEMGWNHRTIQLWNTFLMSSRKEDERPIVRRAWSENGRQRQITAPTSCAPCSLRCARCSGRLTVCSGIKKDSKPFARPHCLSATSCSCEALCDTPKRSSANTSCICG